MYYHLFYCHNGHLGQGMTLKPWKQCKTVTCRTCNKRLTIYPFNPRVVIVDSDRPLKEVSYTYQRLKELAKGYKHEFR